MFLYWSWEKISHQLAKNGAEPRMLRTSRVRVAEVCGTMASFIFSMHAQWQGSWRSLRGCHFPISLPQFIGTGLGLWQLASFTVWDRTSCAMQGVTGAPSQSCPYSVNNTDWLGMWWFCGTPLYCATTGHALEKHRRQWLHHRWPPLLPTRGNTTGHALNAMKYGL